MTRSTKSRKPAAKKPATTPKSAAHPPLPGRPPITDAEANAASATLYAGSLRIHAPYTTWTGQPDNTANTVLDDDTHLLYTRTPHGSSIEAAALCAHGIWHTALITDGHELPPLAQAAGECTLHTPTPLTERALTLGTGLHRANAAAEDTQQLSRADIDATLRADHDQAQPHPTETTPGYDIALAATEAHSRAAAQHQNQEADRA